MQPCRLAAASVLLCLAVGSPATAADAAGVEGSLTYNGATRPLDHVLILRHGNEEGMEDGARLRILLSDREIPRRYAGGATVLGSKTYAIENGITAVVVRGDPAGKERGGQISLLNAPGMEPGLTVSTSTTNAFEALEVAGDNVRGAVALRDPPFALSAKFSAPITPDPVTADLKGKPAVESAPAKALIALYDALGKGDLAGAGKYASPAKMKGMVEFRTQAGDEAFRRAVSSELGTIPLAKRITRVVIRGTNAAVLLGRGELAELVQESDGWRVE